jgi:hypothetical protein
MGGIYRVAYIRANQQWRLAGGPKCEMSSAFCKRKNTISYLLLTLSANATNSDGTLGVKLQACPNHCDHRNQQNSVRSYSHLTTPTRLSTYLSIVS